MSISQADVGAGERQRETGERAIEERPTASTRFELDQGEGDYWASLEVIDLDPPTPTPPQLAG